MSVFRVEKNKGYTVMSNHHLRNHTLSLKAKGLLSQMLSLPDWQMVKQMAPVFLRYFRSLPLAPEWMMHFQHLPAPLLKSVQT